MELPVLAFVLIVVGAALFGFAIGLVTLRWHRSRTSDSGGSADGNDRNPEPTAAETAEQAPEDDRDLAAELARADARIEDLEARLRSSEESVQAIRDEAAVAKRELADFQSRFSDIVGLEAENSTLRLIAARVPELERRLTELEADPPAVIDLRETPAQSG